MSEKLKFKKVIFPDYFTFNGIKPFLSSKNNRQTLMKSGEKKKSLAKTIEYHYIGAVG